MMGRDLALHHDRVVRRVNHQQCRCGARIAAYSSGRSTMPDYLDEVWCLARPTTSSNRLRSSVDRIRHEMDIRRTSPPMASVRPTCSAPRNSSWRERSITRPTVFCAACYW
jgi:hypothetical protein